MQQSLRLWKKGSTSYIDSLFPIYLSLEKSILRQSYHIVPLFKRKGRGVSLACGKNLSPLITSSNICLSQKKEIYIGYHLVCSKNKGYCNFLVRFYNNNKETRKKETKGAFNFTINCRVYVKLAHPTCFFFYFTVCYLPFNCSCANHRLIVLHVHRHSYEKCRWTMIQFCGQSRNWVYREYTHTHTHTSRPLQFIGGYDSFKKIKDHALFPFATSNFYFFRHAPGNKPRTATFPHQIYRSIFRLLAGFQCIKIFIAHVALFPSLFMCLALTPLVA